MLVLQWFQETFSTSSEQAKLFSITISTLLAVSLLLLNQWFVGSRSKRSFKITKIEELLVEIYKYERSYSEALISIYDHPRTESSLQEQIDNSTESAAKIEMLCTLYFSKAHFKSEIALKKLLIAQSQFQTTELNQDNSKINYISLGDCTKYLKSITEPLKIECRNLMKSLT